MIFICSITAQFSKTQQNNEIDVIVAKKRLFLNFVKKLCKIKVKKRKLNNFITAIIVTEYAYINRILNMPRVLNMPKF